MTGSEIAAWWDKNHRESNQALDDFVDAHPHFWGLAAVTATAMDIGAGTVDLLRFGEGAAESYETGKIAPLLQDVLRGVTIAASVAGAATTSRSIIGKIKLYTDPGGELCTPISIGNALRRTGQKLLLSLDEISEAGGSTLAKVSREGFTDPQLIASLKKLGAKFQTLPSVGSFEELAAVAKRGEGVVSVPLNASGGGGHTVLLEKTLFGGVRIVDRTGFYKSLADLSKRYGTTFTVDTQGSSVLVKLVTARLVNGSAALMIYSKAIIVKLNDGLTVPQLDAKFKEFKKTGVPKAAAAAAAGSATYSVVSGDTLSGLAQKKYGAPQYWPLLWDVNRGVVGSDPNRITPGMRLQIPPLSSFTPAQLEDARRRHSSWRNY